jgi:riboflavin kinase/FMN adenylyltransferase
MEFAALSPEEFARDVLAGFLKARVVLVGEDFRFGYKQGGNIDTLRELGARYGFELQPVGAVEGGSLSDKGKRVSSTRIRELVAAGKVSKACRLIGAPFALEGAVVSGQGIGSKKTVPTLNLAVENELLPKVGVYVTRTSDGEGRQWQSITNVGYRPTFDGVGLTVETFLLNGAPDPPPSRIEVTFLTFVRSEVRFETPELLKARILRDVSAAKRFHARFARLSMG